MITPIGNLLLPAIIFTIIGFIVGALVSYFFISRPAEAEEIEKPVVEEPPAPHPSAAKEPYTGLPLERFEPLARLYRENSTGKLVTEVDKRIYLNPEMLTPEHLKKLREAAESWNAWLGLQVPVVPTPASPSLADNLPRPEIPTSTLPFMPDLLIQPEKPRATTVVGQIDEILQVMLKESPYAKRGIQLVQDPTLGVMVWLDAQKYPGIEAVPDEDIKNLIRSAVKKWEETEVFK